MRRRCRSRSRANHFVNGAGQTIRLLGVEHASSESCDNVTCWDSSIAAVATDVPVVTGEFDEDNFDNSSCANRTASTFDTDYVNWADAHGVSYLAWGWEVHTPEEISDQYKPKPKPKKKHRKKKR